ncbi:MAG: carboxypeptidase-like regulatory domain-containing protein [Balneolaceae bacterium]|nr:MAG: carboxypeptidase-like regulatory domain-containing protein [Balneolaceae bacterium]
MVFIKRLIWLLVAFLFFLVFQVDLFGQDTTVRTIHGTVTDSADNQTIQNVHVYLSNTTDGTVTDAGGHYILKTELTGHFTLVFSHVGYDTKSVEIRLGEETEIEATTELHTVVYDLNGVAIIAEADDEWERNLDLFTKEFIGTSFIAQDAEILNPWIIEFGINGNGQLEANASEPLLIEHHALGYHIHVDLISFRWDPDEGTGHYTFFHRFTEMESDSWRQRRSWRYQRRLAFRGSFEHFLHSLYHDQLSQDKFMTAVQDSFKTTEIELLNQYELDEYLADREIKYSSHPGLKGFRIRENVDIIFLRSYARSVIRERSRLVPQNPSNIFLVTEHGRLFHPLSLRIDGVWSQHRIGDLLPVGFTL